MAKNLTLKNVLQLLGAIGGAGLGGIGGEIGGSIGGGRGGLVPFGAGSFEGEATSYPASQMSVTLNDAENNATIKRAVAQKASLMQTIDEHNRALSKFLRPGQTPMERSEALRKGREAEKKLWSFWTDSRPRINYSPSSTAVESIRITPDNRVEVKWRNSKKMDNDGFYTFLAAADPFQASEAFNALVTAPSIGRAVYPVYTRNVKNPQPNLGWWNMTHFDPSKSPGLK